MSLHAITCSAFSAVPYITPKPDHIQKFPGPHPIGSTTQLDSHQPCIRPTRRQILTAGSAALLIAASPTKTTDALPLAPLGSTAERIGGPKLTGLSPEEVKDILSRNLKDGQYFITGDLTPEIFADDCRFRDPTNDIRGLSRYVRALGILFDASYSAVRLRDIKVVPGTRSIEAEWTLGGYLKFPWHPRVEPFIGHTVYYLNPDGLVEFQDQTWSVSAGEALRETFTPTSGPRSDIVDMS